jgi:hypothetical protein
VGFIKIPGIDISPADALVSDVKSPKTFFSVAAPIKTGTMPTVALVAGSNAYPQGYHVGDALGLKHVDPNLQAAFILAGVNIFGTIGTSGLFDRWFPVTIHMAAPTVVADPPDHTDSEPAAIDSDLIAVTGDDVAQGVKELTPSVALADAETHAAPDQTDSETPAIGSQLGLQMLIDGAVADDGGAETDETAAARNATANDMTLLPAAPAVGDAYMLGSRYPIEVFWLNIGTAGAGNWTLQMFYWDGAAWAACVDEVENSAQFQASGLKYWKHTPQGDWASHAIQGMDLYWVRIEVVGFVNLVTQPLGTQSWWELLI